MQRLYIATVALFWSFAAHGHHSIARVYDAASRVTIEAVVTDFQFVNPHPMIVVEITAVAEGQLVDDTDTRVPWTLEMDNRRELAELGFA